MWGKTKLENYPGMMEPASHPLGQVHMDLNSSSIMSIEGCNHSVIFDASNSGFRWQYGMKRIDETLDNGMSKRCYAEISDIREKYPLILVVSRRERQ